jgi:hypothetical protein
MHEVDTNEQKPLVAFAVIARIASLLLVGISEIWYRSISATETEECSIIDN